MTVSPTARLVALPFKGLFLISSVQVRASNPAAWHHVRCNSCWPLVAIPIAAHCTTRDEFPPRAAAIARCIPASVAVPIADVPPPARSILQPPAQLAPRSRARDCQSAPRTASHLPLSSIALSSGSRLEPSYGSGIIVFLNFNS